MVEVLVSGCSDSEYCYDAVFGGRPNGAFSYYGMKNIVVGETLRQWYGRITKELPSTSYPQTPQLEGKDESKDRVLWKNGYGGQIIVPEPGGGGIAWYWIVAAVAVIGIILYFVLR